MKIYINRKPNYAPYGGGAKWVNAFYEFINKFTKHEIVNIDQNPDFLVCAGVERDNDCLGLADIVNYKQTATRYMKHVPILFRVNDCDARKNTTHVDKALVLLSQYVDTTVFVSHWLEDYFMSQGWQCPDVNVIYNGVDSTLFKPNVKINNGKTNIVSAHWSDNPLKGEWLNLALDEFVGNNTDKFSFTFIGRTKAKFKHSTHIQPLTEAMLGLELGKYDISVTASVADPGPNHAIEAISCGLPTYSHKDGGGCCEFTGQSHVYNDWNHLKSILENRQFEKNTTKFCDWNQCITRYVSHLE